MHRQLEQPLQEVSSFSQGPSVAGVCRSLLKRPSRFIQGPSQLRECVEAFFNCQAPSFVHVQVQTLHCKLVHVQYAVSAAKPLCSFVFP